METIFTNLHQCQLSHSQTAIFMKGHYHFHYSTLTQKGSLAMQDYCLPLYNKCLLVHLHAKRHIMNSQKIRFCVVRNSFVVQPHVARPIYALATYQCFRICWHTSYSLRLDTPLQLLYASRQWEPLCTISTGYGNTSLFFYKPLLL